MKIVAWWVLALFLGGVVGTVGLFIDKSIVKASGFALMGVCFLALMIYFLAWCVGVVLGC